jgi:hypothetical protein
MACDSAVYGTSAVCGYSGTDLCNFLITIFRYAGLLKGHCQQCEVRDMAWKRPGDQRALCPYKNRNFMSLFGENRTVRYDEYSVIEILWAIKRKATTTSNAAHASHLQCHSISTQSLTLWHNFPNRVKFEKFCGSINLTLTFVNTHEKPLLLPRFFFRWFIPVVYVQQCLVENIGRYSIHKKVY